MIGSTRRRRLFSQPPREEPMEFLSEMHAWYVDEYGPEPEPEPPAERTPAPAPNPVPPRPRARGALLYSPRVGGGMAVHSRARGR
jgi:hypothetical protein